MKACKTCKDTGIVLNKEKEEIFCPDCIGNNIIKQYKWRQDRTKEILKDPKSQRLILVFKDNNDKEEFMAGLCDGWGEGHCDLEWIGDFHKAKEVVARPFEVDDDNWNDP